jgi:hypothetical protein
LILNKPGRDVVGKTHEDIEFLEVVSAGRDTARDIPKDFRWLM